MQSRTSMISESDARNLYEMVDDSWYHLIADEQILELLKERLNESLVVPDEDLSPTVVTMNSVVTLQFPEGVQCEKLKLVHPSAASILSARLSVLSPIGVAIIGRWQGDTISTNNTSGSRQFLIKQVEQRQPETAAAY